MATRDLRVGAIVAGIGWQIVQILGTYLVAHWLKGSSEAYGVFGLVLGLIAWIYLLAFVMVMAAEVNVVAQRRLWPRSLLTPFTDRVELTSADERAYTAYAESERHKGFENIDVGLSGPKKRPTPTEANPAAPISRKVRLLGHRPVGLDRGRVSPGLDFGESPYPPGPATWQTQV